MFNAGFSSFRAASSFTALVLNAFQLLHASMSMFVAVDLAVFAALGDTAGSFLRLKNIQSSESLKEEDTLRELIIAYLVAILTRR